MLRAKVIRLAATLPVGSAQRRALLDVLKQAPLGDVLDLLESLKALDENLTNVEDTFSLHYAAVTNPEVASQVTVLIKAREGLVKARGAQQLLEKLVVSFPEDKGVGRALAEATKIVERFTKHVEVASTIIRKISKKETPDALKKLSAQVATAIRARLIDPDQLDVFAWQREAQNYSTRVIGVQHQVRFRVTYMVPAGSGFDAKPYERKVDLVLMESTVADAPGVQMAAALNGEHPYQTVPATKAGAVDLFLKYVEGWQNVKGESEGASGRLPKAGAILTALSSVLSRLGDTYGNKATVSADFRTVEGSTRMDELPRGESGIEEWRYNEMIDEGTARAKKAVESALASYMKDIAKIEYNTGEKSWMYVSVTLK